MSFTTVMEPTWNTWNTHGSHLEVLYVSFQEKSGHICWGESFHWTNPGIDTIWLLNGSPWKDPPMLKNGKALFLWAIYTMVMINDEISPAEKS